MTIQLKQAIQIAQSLPLSEQLELLTALSKSIRQTHSQETQPQVTPDEPDISDESVYPPWQQAITEETLPVSQLLQSKLNEGKYRSAEEVLAVALQLLDEYERSESEWVEDVRAKIDAAIETSEHTPPIDGETFVNGILERFQQAKQP